MKEIEHGTEKGAKQHHRRGETACPRCQTAAYWARKTREDAKAADVKPSPTEVLWAAEKDAAVARILAYLGSR
jgi:hypothetical protein